jgi:hypothetical protein
MKKIALSLVFFASVSLVFAQPSVNGKITCNDQSKTTIELTSQHPVDLYAAFRQEKNRLHFIFDGVGLQTNANEEAYALIEFTTIIFFNGKQVDIVKRKPFPFFPGDMFMPIETFDMIPSLQQLANKNNGLLPKGNYEVRLQAKSADAKGVIENAIIWFKL